MGDLINWFTDPANWSGSDGIPTRLWEQVWISGISIGVAAAIVLPIGVYLGHKGTAPFLAVSVSNVGRAVPTFGLLMIFASIPAIGVGNLAAIVALILFAIPPLLTNAYVGVRGVDENVRGAARAMGMSGILLLYRVELPHSVPMIAAGIRTATVQVVATASLAALVGGGGLGVYIVEGFAIQNNTLLIAGALLTAAVAVVTEVILARAQKLVTPRGLRLRQTALEAAT